MGGLVSLVERVELGDGLFALLHLSGASQEPSPLGLEPLLPLPDPLVRGLAGLVSGPLTGDPSAEVLGDMAEEDMLLIKIILYYERLNPSVCLRMSCYQCYHVGNAVQLI